ncbi:MAG: ribonuclease III [Oscillospiraceae bacterium]|jgi:ribonuclease-3|nr:ribonuclease III [Oscillospiraceae bacterium]
MTPEELQQTIGYQFKDPELLRRALTHSSYANERKPLMQSNERLEFLGDSVLGFIAAEYFYQRCPQLPEGEMTKMRAAAVCEPALYGYAQTFGLGGALLLGRGEAATGGAHRPSMVADAFEALLAAMYLDGGMEPCRAFVVPFLGRGGERPALEDSKTLLQQIIQQNPEDSVQYALVEETGPDHEKCFVVEVRLHSNVLGVGRGRSKKLAEQAAAAEALRLFRGRE